MEVAMNESKNNNAENNNNDRNSVAGGGATHKEGERGIVSAVAKACQVTTVLIGATLLVVVFALPVWLIMKLLEKRDKLPPAQARGHVTQADIDRVLPPTTTKSPINEVNSRQG
jgi:hypothetical protein